MKLAIHGGEPARRKPLPPNYPGAVMMGEEEAGAAGGVLLSKSPFRYYGINHPHTVRHFESRMASDLNMPFVLGTTSCTASLITAMKAVGIGWGDKVAVPAVTFQATAGAVLCCGAVPVYVDVDNSLNMDPDQLEKILDEEVRAIIPVHLLGSPCNMDGIMHVSQKFGIPVIEDVAQSCGARYENKYCGTIGNIGVFSFQLNKLITSGEGGAVVTRDKYLFERVVRYHDQGLFRETERYGMNIDDNETAFAGQNYRMSELTGAVLVEQWKKLGHINSITKAARDRMVLDLGEECDNITFRFSHDRDGELGAYLGIVMPTVKEADFMVEALKAENISAYIQYAGKPVYMNPQLFHMRTAERANSPYDYPFKHPIVPCAELSMPVASGLLPRTVFVSVSPLLTEQDTLEMTRGISKVYKYLIA